MPVSSSSTTVQAIKSVQRGVLTIINGLTTATATITAVNLSKSELRYGGSASANTALTDARARVYLNSATQVGAIRTGTVNQCDVTWEVTEWY